MSTDGSSLVSEREDPIYRVRSALQTCGPTGKLEAHAARRCAPRSTGMASAPEYPGHPMGDERQSGTECLPDV